TTCLVAGSMSAGAQQPAPAAPPEKPAVQSRPTAAPRQAAARPAETPAPVEVHTSASRTAVWVGDPITYTIELRCAAQVDIVTEDRGRGGLRVDGLEIRDVAIDREVSEAGLLTSRVNYSLVTYNLDAPALKIGEIPVRYSIRRPGQRAEDPAPPSGEVRVPP